MHLFNYRYAYQASNITYYWAGFKHFSGEGRTRCKISPGSWLDTLPKIQKARHDFNTLKSEHCMQTKLLTVTPPWLQIPPWLQNISPSFGQILLFWHNFISIQNNPKIMLQIVSPTLKQWSVKWQQHYTDCQGIVHCRTKTLDIREGQTLPGTTDTMGSSISI